MTRRNRLGQLPFDEHHPPLFFPLRPSRSSVPTLMLNRMKKHRSSNGFEQKGTKAAKEEEE